MITSTQDIFYFLFISREIIIKYKTSSIVRMNHLAPILQFPTFAIHSESEKQTQRKNMEEYLYVTYWFNLIHDLWQGINWESFENLAHVIMFFSFFPCRFGSNGIIHHIFYQQPHDGFSCFYYNFMSWQWYYSHREKDGRKLEANEKGNWLWRIRFINAHNFT